MKTIRIITIVILFSFQYINSYSQLFVAREIYNRADSLRGELTPLRTCYDIKSYFLDVDIDINNRSLAGKNKFIFEAVDDFSRLQFDLFDNLSVDSIVYGKQNLNFEREYNAVFVDFPIIVPKGRLDSFEVYYSGRPLTATRAPWDGGFDWKKDSKGTPWVATACQGLGASVWWPNKDHQSDKVDSMTLSVTVPKGLINVSNGRLLKEENVGDNKKKYVWKVSYPINNYNIALNIGDYEHFKDEYYGENGLLDVEYYVLKENKDKIDHLKRNAVRTLQAFEHWFGPYPFYNDGYKIVETAHLGMEHQSAIAYGNKYQNGYLGTDGSGTGWGMKWDFIIVHESGHEWFGNNITSKDLGDMWIHEAFTNYSESLFIEFFYGKDAGQEYIYGNRQGIKNDKPLRGPLSVNKSGSGDMYLKGGVILNMLRTIIDDDVLWRNMLRDLNKDFYLQTVDYKDIVDYILDYTQLDLDKFFEQYILTADLPTLEIRLNDKGYLEGRWKSTVKNFKMPIHLGENEKGKELIWLTDRFQKLNIPVTDNNNISIDTFNYYIKTSFL